MIANASKSWVVLFNALTVILELAQPLINQYLGSVIPSGTMLVINAVINILLRFKTNQSLEDRGSPTNAIVPVSARSQVEGLFFSKTFWVNAATLALSVVTPLATAVPYGPAVLAIINIVLRALTTGSLSEKMAEVKPPVDSFGVSIAPAVQAMEKMAEAVHRMTVDRPPATQPIEAIVRNTISPIPIAQSLQPQEDLLDKFVREFKERQGPRPSVGSTLPPIDLGSAQ